MHFCIKCSNMLYISLSEQDGSLSYYCRNCGHIDSGINATNNCVSRTNLKKGAQSHTHSVNKYTKLDPTLPRISTIKCPNAECSSNKKAAGNGSNDNEIIYIRYDDANLNYIYLCAKCDTLWKTEQTSS